MLRGKNQFQTIWGGVLILAGIAVFFRIPQVMPELGKIPSFSLTLPFIRISLYFLGLLLVAGGIKKIRDTLRS